MRVRVLLFAGLREGVGQKELLLEPPAGTRVRDLLAQIEQRFAVVTRYRGRLHISLNQKRADMDATLRDGDELALLPPLSGGSGVARLSAAPLSMDALLEEVRAPDCGGIVTFTGVVRDHSRGQSIERLEYEAYEPMAEREIEAIVAAVRARWPQVRLALAHRVGRLAIGDAAVMIVAAAPHRAEAFEAARFAIDALKQSVPIWKKEFAQSGAYWVEENP